NLGILQDSSGDSISHKNPYYGELTVWYWVWKNYLPLHQELEYVGFCHYRRFIDFMRKPTAHPLKGISYMSYIRNLEKYQSLPPYSSVYALHNYDIILPKKLQSQYTMEEKYAIRHNEIDFKLCKEVIAEKYPEYIPTMESVCKRKQAYHYLTFVMRREYFEALATWTFDILFELERRSNWEQYTSYDEIRTPAYLMERFFNVWVEYNIAHHGYKVLHRRVWLLRKESTLQNYLNKLYRYIHRCSS
ncbi:MAG: DUF4422 domain-containing protein, partial [Desulfovibrionaceae bacterium]|nr:DUF4422 domain-containing protein [Desulfovibrionaceae bacterium]